MQSALVVPEVSQRKPNAAGLAAGDDKRWAGVLAVVAAEYPYCTMHGVHLVDGCIVACEAIQSSFVFDGSAAAQTADSAFDSHWKALRALCARLGHGRMAEIRFSRGRPVSARISEGGRRFRRLVTKAVADGMGRSPMN